MSELRINNITDTAGSSGPIIAGVSTVTSTSHMVMPSGPTEMRGGRGRGVFAGSANPSYTNVMDFVEIAKLLQNVMSGYQSISQKPDCPSYLRDIQTLDDAVKADQWGREEAQQRMQKRVAA